MLSLQNILSIEQQQHQQQDSWTEEENLKKKKEEERTAVYVLDVLYMSWSKGFHFTVWSLLCKPARALHQHLKQHHHHHQLAMHEEN